MQRKLHGNPFENFFRILFSARPWRSIRELIRFRIQRPDYKRNPGWVLRIDLGRGAGYKLGRTAYVRGYGWRLVSVGFTRNGNRVPLLY